MERSHMDFRSRVSARAVLAGVVCSFALLFLLSTLAGGLGLWEFKLLGPRDFDSGFWISSSLVWIVSSYCGGFVAALSSRPESLREGVFHGLLTWASACVLGCTVVAIVMRDVFGTDLWVATPATLLATFFGNLFALSASLLGGRQGALYESKIARMEIDKKNEQRLAA
ncbi:MAG: hypothetical protein ACXVB9_00945 [Bdellovibrionota bacterium]